MNAIAGPIAPPTQDDLDVIAAGDGPELHGNTPEPSGCCANCGNPCVGAMRDPTTICGHCRRKYFGQPRPPTPWYANSEEDDVRFKVEDNPDFDCGNFYPR